MAGGLNDLELETLDEVNLSDSPPQAARPPLTRTVNGTGHRQRCRRDARADSARASPSA